MSGTTQAEKEALALFADLLGEPGALLPVLHRVQERLGHVPPHYVPLVAHALNLSRAEVQGVLSFYHDFRSEPAGRHVVRICQAEACQAMGGGALTAYAAARLGAALHATSGDRRFTLEPVYCLGNCACSPALMIDGVLHGRVSAERFDALLDALPG